MGKLEEAKEILKELGLPSGQRNDRSALVLLALCHLREGDKWKNAKPVSMSVVGNKENAKYEGILRFIAEHYHVQYAENSRETIRRQTLHQFVQAGIAHHNPEDPSIPTNSKDNHYRLTPEALEVIRAFGSKKWKKELKRFLKNTGSLEEKYAKKRDLKKIPLVLSDGKTIKFSPGKHNELQIAIIREFAPRFTPGSLLLYVGDTAKKNLFIDRDKMEELGIPFDEHQKLPDVILFDTKRDLLFLVEAVTSHGPVSPKRLIELEKLFERCKIRKVYITAFPDFKTFKRFSNDIAWDTEAWLAEIPEHMIHFNGDKFLSPKL